MSRYKPKGQKVISGSKHEVKDLVNLPAPDKYPVAPKWLSNKEAIREWDRMVPVLLATGLLSLGDLPAFANYCSVHGRLAEIWAAGATPPAGLLQQFVALGSAFGLAPAWRAKVKPIDETGKKNPFSKHRIIEA